MTETKNECVLCKVWDRMPYGKRHTTPVTVPEAEGALVTGYWIRTNVSSNVAPRLCERHASVLQVLDEREAAHLAHLELVARERAEAEQALREHQARAPEFAARAGDLAARLIAPVMVHPAPAPPVVPFPPVSIPQAPAPVVAVEPSPVLHELGEPPPPVPAVVLSEPPPYALPGAAEGAPGQQAFPCPLCGKPSTPGQVHICEELVP